MEKEVREDIIRVEHLEKRFRGVKAVNDISFQVKRGELFGFLGVNGAGKSTTINILCTLYQKTSGEAWICGVGMEEHPEEIRRRIGAVFQHNILDDVLTVRENLLLRGSLYTKDRARIAGELKDTAEILDIGNLLERRYRDLSGGQKRRCEIARALMNVPEVLFLDEPTTGLDPQTRMQVWESVERLRRERQMTVFLTTHYMEEAARASHICIMDEGRIVAEGTPDALKNKHARDILRLYSRSPEELAGLARRKNFKGQVLSNCLCFPLSETREALPILNALEGAYDNFEVLQGDMDDVFLHVTGKKLGG